MIRQLPLRKFIRVWLKKRKNPSRQDGSQTTSYTLEWMEYGQRRFMSLGRGATAAYARQARADKEKELNSPEARENLVPITWLDFKKKYLDTYYPGHDLPVDDRQRAVRDWSKSFSSFRSERLALAGFQRIAMESSGRTNSWCHDIGDQDRELFANHRIKEVPSGESVDADLRNLRTVFNVMEDWKHRPPGSNPFAGRKKATIGARLKRTKKLDAENASPKHYSRAHIVALLKQADKEVIEQPESWERHRLRALVYFEAYTGARIGEVLHLEWEGDVKLEGGGFAKEVDFELGVAFLNWKAEHGLKTQGSEAPIGLPDVLIAVLREWKNLRTCRWVFPNSEGKPWTTGGPNYKPLHKLKALAKRAGVDHATWKMFRHSLNTHGKQWFGLNKEQIRLQLRHEDDETQKHYDHADLTNLREAVKGIDFDK